MLQKKLFSQTQKPPTYFRYFDDTFPIIDHEAKADEFLTKLNCLHPSIRFTFAKEKGKYLPFLDVYVERTDIGFGDQCVPETHFHWPVFALRVL